MFPWSRYFLGNSSSNLGIYPQNLVSSSLTEMQFVGKIIKSCAAAPSTSTATPLIKKRLGNVTGENAQSKGTASISKRWFHCIGRFFMRSPKHGFEFYSKSKSATYAPGKHHESKQTRWQVKNFAHHLDYRGVLVNDHDSPQYLSRSRRSDRCKFFFLFWNKRHLESLGASDQPTSRTQSCHGN